MTGKSLPREIFAKIFMELGKKGSHADIQNLKKALNHPELTYLQQTFNHLTSRSKLDSCEKGNFICPICLFNPGDNYDDSLWNEVCDQIFSCHFIMFGGNETVELKPSLLEPNSKRIKIMRSNSQVLKFHDAEEFLYGQKDKPISALGSAYCRRIQFCKNDKRVLKFISDILSTNLEIYTKIDDFIEHLKNCTYWGPLCEIMEEQDIYNINFHKIMELKSQGNNLDEMVRPRQLLEKLQNQLNVQIPKSILMGKPNGDLFDQGSQNTNFIESVGWPIIGLATSILLEDHITSPTKQFEAFKNDDRIALALRDILHCVSEVSESYNYDFEMKPWIKSKFGEWNGMLQILNSFFPKY